MIEQAVLDRRSRWRSQGWCRNLIHGLGHVLANMTSYPPLSDRCLVIWIIADNARFAKKGGTAWLLLTASEPRPPGSESEVAWSALLRNMPPLTNPLIRQRSAS